MDFGLVVSPVCRFVHRLRFSGSDGARVSNACGEQLRFTGLGVRTQRRQHSVASQQRHRPEVRAVSVTALSIRSHARTRTPPPEPDLGRDCGERWFPRSRKGFIMAVLRSAMSAGLEAGSVEYCVRV
jgi:hypothetical protein